MSVYITISTVFSSVRTAFNRVLEEMWRDLLFALPQQDGVAGRARVQCCLCPWVEGRLFLHYKSFMLSYTMCYNVIVFILQDICFDCLDNLSRALLERSFSGSVNLALAMDSLDVSL